MGEMVGGEGEQQTLACASPGLSPTTVSTSHLPCSLIDIDITKRPSSLGFLTVCQLCQAGRAGSAVHPLVCYHHGVVCACFRLCVVGWLVKWVGVGRYVAHDALLHNVSEAKARGAGVL